MMRRPWLYVTDSKLGGVGIDQVTVEQLRAFSEAEVPVDLIARGRIKLPGVRCHAWPLPPTKLLSWLPSQDYYALNKRFFGWLGPRYLAEHAGVVAWSKTALLLFEAAQKRGIPRLLNVGNLHCDHDVCSARKAHRWPRIELARYRAEYSLASRILLPSEFAAKTFIAQGVPAEKLAVVHRGVDLARFVPLADKPPRPFIVASCGHLGERKGSYQLLKLWRELALPDAELWLVGHIPDNEKAALEALAGPTVRFWGFRKDLPELLHKAHLHVLLSRNEGFAKVLIEAAACGVANLCTPEGGMPADAAGTLFVADRNDLDSIGDFILQLHADPAEADRLGREARAWVEARFGWDQFRRRVAVAIAAEEAA